MRKFLFVVGTRMDAVGMAPLVRALRAQGNVDVRVCVIARHRETFDPLLSLFDIAPDYALNPALHDHASADAATAILPGIGALLDALHPNTVLVRGDTTMTLMVSLAAFYRYLPVAHVDAGLRSSALGSPWPAQLNRRMTDALSTWHFAPTERAQHNLFDEGVPADSVTLTGDTVIDALQSVKRILDRDDAFARAYAARYPFLDDTRRVVLVAGRREHAGGDAFAHFCHALRMLASRYRNVQFVYALHRESGIDDAAHALLDGASNIHVIEPQEYLPFVFLMSRAHFIIADSNGIQEEGPALGKPVLAARDASACEEAIQAGTVRLVGSDPERIVREAAHLIDDDGAYAEMTHARNPYGDGHACERIVHALLDRPCARQAIASVGMGAAEMPYNALALGLHALRSA